VSFWKCTVSLNYKIHLQKKVGKPWNRGPGGKWQNEAESQITNGLVGLIKEFGLYSAGLNVIYLWFRKLSLICKFRYTLLSL
jgi:hypothetical protein